MYRRRGEFVKDSSVWDILHSLPNPPRYSAVRSVVNILESKGLLKHRRVEHKYIYTPAIAPKKAMRDAVTHLMKMHFGNSIESAITAILEIHNDRVTEEELNRLSALKERAKEEGGP
jgi:predicted transcriptional regulator